MRFTGVVLSLLLVGCAAVEHAPPGSAVQKEETAPVPAPEPAPAAVAVAPPAATPAAGAAPASALPVVAAPSRAQPGKPGVARSTPAAAPPSTKVPPTPAAAPTAAPAPLAPPLDLATLEARLRGTDAIGMFTKIALKNQVDDLLDQFREYYAGKARTSLAELRPAYDRLLMKVLALLQDDDPDLARAIVDSREPIWGILADPKRFATL